MNPTLKHLLKIARWRIRRMQAARKWGAVNLRRMPAVLGNAMPKSGSHLIIQVLEGLVHFGPFVYPSFMPLNRTEDNIKVSDERIVKEIKAMRPGDIRYGYLQAHQPWVDLVTGPGRATVFVYRDPRDWVISQVFYAVDMHDGHMMHDYYSSLPTMEDRINASIEGVNTPQVSAPSLVERYSHYAGWLETEGVLCLRFEDLILERDLALGNILDYLATFDFRPSIPRTEAIAYLARGIAPQKSGTFRKGQPGNWREHFTAENLARFKAATGDLLERLGYEE